MLKQRIITALILAPLALLAILYLPRNREIVSCRACVRAEPMLGGNASQI